MMPKSNPATDKTKGAETSNKRSKWEKLGAGTAESGSTAPVEILLMSQEDLHGQKLLRRGHRRKRSSSGDP